MAWVGVNDAKLCAGLGVDVLGSAENMAVGELRERRAVSSRQKEHTRILHDLTHLGGATAKAVQRDV